jgi:hypothetical protein
MTKYFINRTIKKNQTSEKQLPVDML